MGPASGIGGHPRVEKNLFQGVPGFLIRVDQSGDQVSGSCTKGRLYEGCVHPLKASISNYLSFGM